MGKFRKWLIHKLGGYVEEETKCIVKNDGIYFKTGKTEWTVGINKLNEDEIIVGK